MRTLTVDELGKVLGTDKQPFVLDVRDPDEVSDWPMPHSYNIPLSELVTKLDELPKDKTIVTMCLAGARSAQAAALLEEKGFDVLSLQGGITAWAGFYDVATVTAGKAEIVQVRRRGKGCLSYVVGHGDSAFVIDPSVDVDEYVKVASDRGWQIKRVFDTHLHADHISGARELVAKTGASLMLNPVEGYLYPHENIADGDYYEIAEGVGVTVKALHSPGHTMGSVMYVVDGKALISGDTIFVDGAGRPDLAEKAEEYAKELYNSITGHLGGLDPDVTILPAHFGDRVDVLPEKPVATTVDKFQSDFETLLSDRDKFLAWATGKATNRPPNYQRIVRVNQGRETILISEAPEMELGPNRCAI
ncbi:Glyoxylase, beta-lactamase superfamily II [Ferrithrix thermotolerans DSM 19514]|uniref:Glyoxylase, beta-lactamase superfamily II n=1 Tax=Ferrithrix thermotolerans DSM 19514 TaxID=1121881 RepID=A0A1M4XAL3_9ACTN|nr:MBL fold metallo-hydrolase [Ferrithrix thermotolerans]SHE90483.1 Glyoxylase, beta-lactamase superfamily II [Ferrithrix thermotolerans DSM 19514]